MKEMKTIKTDALIIGSGFGAGPPALRLAKMGLKTIVIEKGPNIDPYKDFKQTQDPKYFLKYIKGVSGKNLSFSFGEGLGGGSGFYESVTLRAPSFAFNDTWENGHRLWPHGLSRADMDQYFDLGEKLMEVEQIPYKKIPKTGLVFAMLMKNLGYSTDRMMMAVRNCMNCGRCVTGCTYQSKKSLLLNYIPMAKEAGATYITDTEARYIKEESGSHRYRVVCLTNGEKVEFKTRYLILGAGTIHTATLLLRSAKYLTKLSQHVGSNISFNGNLKVPGLLPDWCPDADMFTGRSIPGITSYEFAESHKIMVSTGKPLPLQLFGTARIGFKGQKSWGKGYNDFLKILRRRVIFMVAHGLTPPSARMTVNRKGKVRLHMYNQEALAKYYKETSTLLKSIIVRNGGKVLDVNYVKRNGALKKGIQFGTAHQMGSCRMAESKDRGVVNYKGEVFGYPGMFITDGSTVPSSTMVNPSLTILANAERMTNEILDMV